MTKEQKKNIIMHVRIVEAPFSPIEAFYGLVSRASEGISCDENGLFVGQVPLLEQDHSLGGVDKWRLLPLFEVNYDLGERYGLPIEFSSKVAGLAAVARALDCGDLAYAQIATLHLRLPDPPKWTKAEHTAGEVFGLALRLKASGILKADWDPAKHPRWSGKSPGGVGGEFAPIGGASVPASDIADTSLTPAQIAIPAPFDIPFPEIPLPSEIFPPPLVAPNVFPRGGSANPYPDRAECVEEWARARKFCRDLQNRGLLGSDAYRGTGMTFDQCVRGQVSEDCGGNSVSV